MSEAVHVLLGYPPSANRLVRLGRGVPYKSKAVTAWTKDAVARLRAVRPKVLEGPVAIAIALHPKATKTGEPYARRIDLDNAIKGVLDACQGLLFTNDNQVTRIHAAVSFPITHGGLTLMAWNVADVAPDFERLLQKTA